MATTNRDRLLQMDNWDFATFLINVAETGSSYFLDAYCNLCKDEHCPPRNGCVYTMQQIIEMWLDMKIE